MKTLAILLASLAAAATTGQRVPPPPDPIAIPMELVANRPVVRLMVNGQGPFAFLVTPEDHTTVIDREVAEALKLKERKTAGGAAEVTIELGFGPGKVMTIPAEVVEGGRGLPDASQKARPRGIISLAAWKATLVTIDYAKWRVTLEAGALPEPNGKDVFALEKGRQFRLPLVLGGDRSVDCRVDPWYPEGLLLPWSYAREIPLEGKPKDWGISNTREGAVHVQEAQLASTLMLGPFELRSPLVLLADGGTMATVGTRWLGRFSVTYDLANERARLEPQAAIRTSR